MLLPAAADVGLQDQRIPSWNGWWKIMPAGTGADMMAVRPVIDSLTHSNRHTYKSCVTGIGHQLCSWLLTSYYPLPGICMSCLSNYSKEGWKWVQWVQWGTRNERTITISFRRQKIKKKKRGGREETQRADCVLFVRIVKKRTASGWMEGWEERRERLKAEESERQADSLCSEQRETWRSEWGAEKRREGKSHSRHHKIQSQKRAEIIMKYDCFKDKLKQKPISSHYIGCLSDNRQTAVRGEKRDWKRKAHRDIFSCLSVLATHREPSGRESVHPKTDDGSFRPVVHQVLFFVSRRAFHLSLSDAHFLNTWVYVRVFLSDDFSLFCSADAETLLGETRVECEGSEARSSAARNNVHFVS